MRILLSEQRDIPPELIIRLYNANGWSAAKKPEELVNALRNSHTLVSAWYGGELAGIGNAISDGHLVVYYPHLLVHPEFHGRGIGKMILEKLLERYAGFHMQMLTADADAIEFYRKAGFVRAGNTQPMWIYSGNEHS